MSFLAATGRLTGAVLVERYDYAPGPAVALDRHTHDQYQLCFNPDYVGQVWIGGAWHTVPKGQVALVPPGETHGVRDVEDRSTPGTYRVLYVEPQLFGGSQFRGFPHTGGALAQRFHRLHAVLEHPAPPQLQRDDLLVLMLADLTRRYACGPVAPRALPPARRQAFIARDLLRDHLSDNVALTDLARAVNLSPFHLLRVFRTEFGLTPHAYQIQARVEHAKRLLARGISVTRAAHDSGFFDSSHLTRHFRRLVGVAPGHYGRLSKASH
ncbi:MAG TPA: AraC family transcriptional regulator [Pilimelia sp.]|nr:AraC family transcriptional regulator [Pilimelia sp.]